MTPRVTVFVAFTFAFAGTWGCRRPVPYPPPAPRGLAAGVDYLVKAQSPDGAWRSDTYGTFKDGTALTPLAVVALIESGATAETAGARRAGSEFLARMVKLDGSIDEGPVGLDYPVYTAALSVVALSHPDNADLTRARDAWLRFLLDRQLTERIGWTPADKVYGGWGYCRTVPRKPAPGQLAAPLIESNLSATTFALDALNAAGHTDAATTRRALAFVAQCQNPDGGFHFIDDDPVRNKAGGDASGFHSYGSATADGYRSLVGHDDRGATAAARWLANHFDPTRHPGTYVSSHERNRDAVYYYYAAAVARMFRKTGNREKAARLADSIRERQLPDGSWSNPVDLVRENDPVVATCWAVIALSNCDVP